jgi:4-amino-4-deoxy-L-arabinose transferase-like glycosyltransferase
VIDEEAHFSYVQQIAEHGSLPIMGKTETSPQGLAIAQGIYPRHTTIDAKRDGLGGLNYEAFQPPLYYIVAVPVFLSTGNYLDKVYALRFFGAILLLVSVALTARLARVVLRERWAIGWSFSLVFFALPGVVVRFATIGNLALAVPLVILFSTELWIAWDRHSGRRLAGAGAVAGLCVLTQLEMLVLLPVFALVVVAEARRRSFRAWSPLIVAAAVPLVLMAPWFLFNEANYHMLTAGSIAIKEQTPIINPHHVHYSLGQLPNDTVNSVLEITLPAEWALALNGQPALQFLDQLVDFLLIPAGLVLALGLGRRLWSVRTGILGLPWILNVFELWYIRYGEQWLIFARYTFPTLPALLMLAAMATDTIRARYLPVLVTAGATVSVAVVWVFLVFSYTGYEALR